MPINDELKAQILRSYFVEHWRVGTIARQLGVHHSTVERVLCEAGVERERRRPRRPSKLDPYMAFLTETLTRFPTLTGDSSPPRPLHAPCRPVPRAAGDSHRRRRRRPASAARWRGAHGGT